MGIKNYKSLRFYIQSRQRTTVKEQRDNQFKLTMGKGHFSKENRSVASQDYPTLPVPRDMQSPTITNGPKGYNSERKEYRHEY